MKKIILILGLIVSLPISFSCSGQNKTATTNDAYMQNLDSLLASYTTMPGYYVRYGNHGCLFDLRVNDNYVDNMTTPSRIGSTLTPINAKILKSGKNKVSLKLYPFPGDSLITEPEPFHLRIQYKDFKQPKGQQPWTVVLEMPQIVVPEEGLPYYQYEGEFEAEVPYQITGWSDCIDLREIPDIESRVVAEFKRIRQLMIDHKFDDLRQLLAFKNYDVGVPLYQSSEKERKEWLDYIDSINRANPEDWQLIDDYKLVFYADGRLVTLESTKESGFPSALLWLKYGEETYKYNTFEMRLGIRKGTDELIPIR